MVLFLSRRRNPSPTLSMADVRRLADRIEQQVGQRVGRLTQPYLREKGAVDVGYGFVVWSPLESDERQVQRVVDECVGRVADAVLKRGGILGITADHGNCEHMLEPERIPSEMYGRMLEIFFRGLAATAEEQAGERVGAVAS